MRLAVLLLALALSGCLVKREPQQRAALMTDATPTRYPRRGFYGRIATNGAPLIRNGTLALSAVDSAARFDVVVLDAPELLRWPKIAQALKDANPGMILLALVNTSMAWGNLSDTTHLNARRYLLAQRMGALLHGRSGRQWGANLDLSNVDFATHLADLDAAALRVPGVDGLFCDWSCPSIAWEQTPRDSVDHRRAGWDTNRDWDRAYRYGHRIYAERLRSHAGAKFLVGNGGPSGERDVFNGWMRENFPNQNGGTWQSNMVKTPWGDPGYLADETLYVRPTLCFLSSVETGDAKRDAAALDLGLASASLAGGVHVFVRAPLLRDWTPAWWPQYDVDLGPPLGPAEPNGDTWSRRFRDGYVIVDVRRSSVVVEKSR